MGHSLSPVIHRAAYAHLGLSDWRYEAHEVDAAGYPAFVDGLDASWRGLSCTMPLKEVAAASGDPDPAVRLTGAANTVILEPQGRTVHNTDVPGFVDALAAAGVRRSGPALLVGNGATARSALVALHQLGAPSVGVLGRDSERVAGFVRWAQERDLPAEPVDQVPSGVAVLVSTVPSAGARDLLGPLAPLEGLAVLFDVSYHPWPTPLAAVADAVGAAFVSGLDLLIGQATHQVRLMTGHEVPVSVLLSAVRAELRRRGLS